MIVISSLFVVLVTSNDDPSIVLLFCIGNRLRLLLFCIGNRLRLLLFCIGNMLGFFNRFLFLYKFIFFLLCFFLFVVFLSLIRFLFFWSLFLSLLFNMMNNLCFFLAVLFIGRFFIFWPFGSIFCFGYVFSFSLFFLLLSGLLHRSLHLLPDWFGKLLMFDLLFRFLYFRLNVLLSVLLFFFSIFRLMLISMLILVMMWFVGPLELSWYITYSCPVFYHFLVLSSHLNEESSAKDFLIVLVSNEVDRIDFHLKDDFKRSCVIVLNLDKVEIRECFFYIILCGIKITLDQVQGYVLYFLI